MRDKRARRRMPGWHTGQQAVVNRLFVYGTLRTGQPARSLIANHVVTAQPASASGRMYALPDGYPGFVPGDEGTVHGEVVTLSELAPAFALLDAYEGDEFVRSLQEVTLSDGTRVWVWTYLLRNPTLAQLGDSIDSGDWAEYLRGG